MNDKELKRWKEKLNISNKKFEEQEKKTKRFKDYYRGFQNDFSASTTEPFFKYNSISNLVGQNVSTITPSIVFKNPRLYVTANKKPYQRKDGTVFDTVAASKAFEILMNYHYDKLRLKRQTRKCVIDGQIDTWGIMRLGYMAEIEKVQDGEDLEINEIVKGDSIYAYRLSPSCFRVDSKAKDHQLEDAEWVGFKWVYNLKDIQRNPRFKNKNNLKANYHYAVDYGVQNKLLEEINPSDRGSREDFEAVEGWEVWNKKEKKIYDICLDHDYVLSERDYPKWGIEGFPVEILYFNENPDELFPISDIQNYIDEQDDLNLLQTMYIESIKKMSSQKFQMPSSLLSPEELNKLEYGPSGTVIQTQGQGEIIPIAHQQQLQDILMAIRLVRNNLKEHAGVAAFERGTAEKFDTATEAGLIAQGVSIAREDRRDIVEDFTVRIISKLAKILQATLTEQSVRLKDDEFKELSEKGYNKIDKIIGQEGQQLIPWLTLSAEDIEGEYEFSMEVGSMMPVNKETRKKDIKEVTEMLMPFISEFNGMEIAKRIFDAYEIRDYEKLPKNPQLKQQEMIQARQMDIQMELAKEMPKKQLDVQKAREKNQTTIMVNREKNMMADKQGKRSFIQDMLKNIIGGKKKEEKPKTSKNDKKE